MKLIVSPAKKMREERDFLPPDGMPEFLGRAQRLLETLQEMPCADLKKLLACNDSIARLNYERFQRMDLGAAATPALLAYDGIQFQYMAPQLFTGEQFSYVKERLRILSGFYGVLRPFDAVTPYRLEMQARLSTEGCRNLYAYWGNLPARFLEREDDTVVNLASEEYAKAVRPHLQEKTRFLTCTFAEAEGERLVEKGVYVKMARGEMVRWLAENNIEEPERLREFSRLGYRFQKALSTDCNYVFVRQPGAEVPGVRRARRGKK